MALFKSALITQGSGSIGGQTLSHNRGGLYLRARAVPVDPATAAQQRIRDTLAALVNNWILLLTPAERAAWDLYAFNVPLPGPLGDLRNVGGLGMYIRANVVTRQGGVARVDTGPVTFNIGSFTPTEMGVASEALQSVGIVFTAADEWANETNSALVVWVSRPQNPSINFFKGPYRLGASILGDDALPPTSPSLITAPFPFVAGQKLFVKIRAIRKDGRLSNIQRNSVIAVA